jgi:hypothetical protein
MSDEKLQDLLRTLPGEDEIAFRAARARHRALARLDEPRRWSFAPALAMAALVLIVAGLLFRGRESSPTQIATSMAPVERQQESLRMKWVLSDGTRVLWTFHNR